MLQGLCLHVALCACSTSGCHAASACARTLYTCELGRLYAHSRAPPCALEPRDRRAFAA